MTGATGLAPLLERFFTQRLMQQRQASSHTIRSYRDTFCQLLVFAQHRLRLHPCRMAFEQIDAPLVAVPVSVDVEARTGDTAGMPGVVDLIVKERCSLAVWPVIVAPNALQKSEEVKLGGRSWGTGPPGAQPSESVSREARRRRTSISGPWGS